MANNQTLKTLLDEFEIAYPQAERKLDFGIPAVAKSSLYDNASKTLTAVIACPHCGCDIPVRHVNGPSLLYHIDQICPGCNTRINASVNDKKESFVRTASYILWFDTSLGDAAVAWTSIKNVYDYDTYGRVCITSSERDIYLIGYVDIDKREMWAQNNGQWAKSGAFKKLGTQYCKTLFETSKNTICGVAIPQQWWKKKFYNDVAVASEPVKTSRQTAPRQKKVVDFTPVAMPIKDVTQFVYSPIETNSLDRTVKNEFWCTTCDNVFEITSTTDEDVTITCPNCGAAKTFIRRELVGPVRSKYVLQTADLGDFYGAGVTTANFNENWEMALNGFFMYCTVEKKTGKQRFYYRDNTAKPFSQKRTPPRSDWFEAVFDNTGLNIKETFDRGEIVDVVNYISKLTEFPQGFAVAAKDKSFAPFIKYILNGTLSADFSKSTPWEILSMDEEGYKSVCNVPNLRSTQMAVAQEWSRFGLKDPTFFVKQAVGPSVMLMDILEELHTTTDRLQEYFESCAQSQYLSGYTAERLWRNYITAAQKAKMPLSTEAEIFPDQLRLAHDRALFEQNGQLN